MAALHNDLRRPEAAGWLLRARPLLPLQPPSKRSIGFLDKVDPEAAQRARYRYACFEHFGEDTQAYGYAAEFGLTRSCEDQAVQQLVDLQRRAADLAAATARLPRTSSSTPSRTPAW